MSTVALFVRLVTAFLLGGIIGIEREIRNQPAGFRTHAILAIGSALIMILSFKGAEIYGPKTSDPMRIAAQVVSGIGFLGAGAILRIGVSIKGLTTAASLWTTAAIGLACGMGLYKAAFITTFFVITSLFFLGKLEKLYLFTKPRKTLFIEAKDVPTLMGDLEAALDKLGYSIDFVELDRDSKRETVAIQLVIRPIPGRIPEENKSKILSGLLSLKEVINVEMR